MIKDKVVKEILAVDEFVDTRVLPEFRPIAAMIRVLLKECAPDSKEYIGYGIPVYKAKRIFAYISSNNKGITFSFSRGVQFEDRYDLLRGFGKSSRHIEIKSLADVNKNALRYYVKQALEFDVK